MKTTFDLPEPLLRELEARAAQEGRSLHDFIAEALAAGLHGFVADPSTRPWMKHFGALADLRQESLRINEVVEAEFENIDPETWQ